MSDTAQSNSPLTDRMWEEWNQRPGYDLDDAIGFLEHATSLECELTAAREQVRQLKAALELGQINCDAVYEDLRAERDAARAACRRAYEFFSPSVQHFDESKVDEKKFQSELILELHALLVGAGEGL